jgi:peptidoglycan/LPS O-acetylase OafA/YrhL
MWLLPEQLSNFAESVGSVLVFLSNIYFMSQVGYLAPDAELQPLLHTWSLAVEEQYYLAFPLIVAWCLRYGLRTFFAVTLILTLSSLALSEVGLNLNAERNFFFTFSRFWELGVGSLCAVISVWRGEFRNGPLALFGLLLILVAVFVYESEMPFAGLYALAPVGGAALVVLFCRSDTFVGKILSHRLPVGIGLISYSAYLYHQPLFAFARLRSAEEPSAQFLGFLSLLSLGLGWLSWGFIEQPFRGRKAVYLPDLRAFGIVFSATSLILFAGVVTVRLQDGYPGRANERFAGEIGHVPFYRDAEARFFPCTPLSIREKAPVFEGRPRCFQSRNDLSVTVAVIGDSHAEHLYSGVAAAMPEYSVVVYLQNAVPFLSDPKMKEIFAELGRNKDLKAVVFAMHWPRRYLEFATRRPFVLNCWQPFRTRSELA